MLQNLKIAELSDVELLELLCSCEDDGELYSNFVNRFHGDVDEECANICKKRKIDSHIGKQIAHDTFERVRKYKKFKKDQIITVNERRGIKVYLFRIATRLFNDHYQKSKKQEVPLSTYFDDIVDLHDSYDDVVGLKRKKDITEIILKKLNLKERTVLIKDIEYKKHQRYLPDDVIESLAEQIGVKKDSIRKIRERAINKIKKAIDEINQ